MYDIVLTLGLYYVVIMGHNIMHHQHWNTCPCMVLSRLQALIICDCML